MCVLFDRALLGSTATYASSPGRQICDKAVGIILPNELNGFGMPGEEKVCFQLVLEQLDAGGLIFWGEAVHGKFQQSGPTGVGARLQKGASAEE